jgi:hypothetical protein
MATIRNIPVTLQVGGTVQWDVEVDLDNYADLAAAQEAACEQATVEVGEAVPGLEVSEPIPGNPEWIVGVSEDSAGGEG